MKKQNTAYKNKPQGYKPYRNNSSLCQDDNKEPSDNIHSNEICVQDKQITPKMNNAALLTSNLKSNSWIIDSDSSSHISNNEKLFTKINDRTKVTIANGKQFSHMALVVLNYKQNH